MTTTPNSETLTKSDLIAKVQSTIQDESGLKLSRANLKTVVDAVLTEIKDTLANGSKVRLDGFGTFVIKEYAATVRPNPRDRTQSVQVAARAFPGFRPGKEFKSLVKESVKVTK